MIGSRKQIQIDPMVSPLDLIKINEKNDSKDNNSYSNSSSSDSSDQSSTSDEKASGEFEAARREALKEAAKETIKLQRQNTKKLNDLLHKSENILLNIRNIIPIFKDEIIIDTNKITVIKRPFFFSEKIHSISVKDITDVYIETVPFFANINIVDANFSETIINVRWFWKNNAEKARRIITGLMEVSKEQIDLKHLKDEDLYEKLEEIGRIRETKTTVSNA